MTHQERMEKLAREFASSIALPCIRSMYPSISRTEMAHHIATSFLAGYQAALGQREAAPVEERDMAREIIDAWDVKHWGRKPIADTSFQYRTREDLIVSFAQALANARAEEKKSGAMEKL